MYSLIESVSANGLESYWYLRYILGKLPDAMAEADYLALLRQPLDQAQLVPKDTILMYEAGFKDFHFNVNTLVEDE